MRLFIHGMRRLSIKIPISSICNLQETETNPKNTAGQRHEHHFLLHHIRYKDDNAKVPVTCNAPLRPLPIFVPHSD